MTQKTSLHDIHQSLGARLVDFAGWELPVQYQGILAEHKHCRTATALFDTCHMGQMLITGPNAAKAISGAITQDAQKLPVGRCKYGFILNEAGGVIDDQILMRLSEDEFFLVVNAATAGHDHEIIAERLGNEGVQMRPSDNWGKLDVQGPTSLSVLAPFCEHDITEMKYFSVVRTKILGHDCILSRTGYTGELGWEIYISNEVLPELFSKLLENPEVKPAGLGARDSLRLEMAMALYGHELAEDINPLEASMDFFIDLDREYVGVQGLRDAGKPTRKLVNLTTAQRRRFNTGDKIFAGEKEIGEITSGVFAPSLSYAIGMGFVEIDHSEPGTELIIRTAKANIAATITTGPFYKEGTARKKIAK